MKKTLFVLPALALLLAGMIFVGCAPSEVDPPPPVGEGILGGNLPSDGKIGIGIVGGGGATGWNGSEEKALVKAGNPGGVGFGIDVVNTTGAITVNIIYKTPITMALFTPPGLNGDDVIVGQENDEGKTVLTLKNVKLSITKVAEVTSPGVDDLTTPTELGDIELKAHWWGSGSELEAAPIAVATAFNNPPSLVNATGTKIHWTMQLQYDGVEVDPQWIE
jgi:hypothetical protein